MRPDARPPRGDERAQRADARRDPRRLPRPRGDGVRVVVLTGAGALVLLGAGPRRRASLDEADLERTLRDEYEPMLRAIYDCPVPTIAAVNGAAAGAGANLALACDVVIATESARLRPGLHPDRPDPGRGRHLLAAAAGRLRTRHGRRALRRAGAGAAGGRVGHDLGGRARRRLRRDLAPARAATSRRARPRPMPALKEALPRQLVNDLDAAARARGAAAGRLRPQPRLPRGRRGLPREAARPRFEGR